jgi:hypothetical protein
MATGATAEHMYDVYMQMDMGLERAFYVFRGRGLYWSKPLLVKKCNSLQLHFSSNYGCTFLSD